MNLVLPRFWGTVVLRLEGGGNQPLLAKFNKNKFFNPRKVVRRSVVGEHNSSGKAPLSENMRPVGASRDATPEKLNDFFLDTSVHCDYEQRQEPSSPPLSDIAPPESAFTRFEPFQTFERTIIINSLSPTKAGSKAAELTLQQGSTMLDRDDLSSRPEVGLGSGFGSDPGGGGSSRRGVLQAEEPQNVPDMNSEYDGFARTTRNASSEGAGGRTEPMDSVHPNPVVWILWRCVLSFFLS